MLIPELNPRITRQIRFLRLRSCVTLVGAKSASLGIISGRKKPKEQKNACVCEVFIFIKSWLVLYSIDMNVFQHKYNSLPLGKKMKLLQHTSEDIYNELLINMLLLSSTRTWTTLSSTDTEILASCISTSETIFSLLCFCFFLNFPWFTKAEVFYDSN